MAAHVPALLHTSKFTVFCLQEPIFTQLSKQPQTLNKGNFSYKIFLYK